MNEPTEKHRAPFPCIVCGIELENVFHPENCPNQPHDACVFNSHGQYGSTVFDEIDGAKLEVNICDACLVEAQKRGAVGYWPGHPRRSLTSWDGQ